MDAQTHARVLRLGEAIMRVAVAFLKTLANAKAIGSRRNSLEREPQRPLAPPEDPQRYGGGRVPTANNEAHHRAEAQGRRRTDEMQAVDGGLEARTQARISIRRLHLGREIGSQKLITGHLDREAGPEEHVVDDSL